ncbi:MAG: Energy-coupling factor transporter transmembrane protein BioN [Candidatus Erwinia impunctatus]|nr:Energy-coupling factor transporter transmembrane protein BioN [Culicoides impunctatus]
MIGEGYVNRQSVVHTMAPAYKIALLALYCTGVFMLTSWPWVAVAGLIPLVGYKIGRLSFRHLFQGLKPALIIVAIIFIFQLVYAGLSFAAFIALRLSCLIVAAHLVTLTTRSSEFVEGILSLLRYAPRWVPAEKIALAISLSLRFIPVLRRVAEEIRMAQRARGRDKNILALLNPFMLRTLKSGDQIAEAIRARSPDL